MTLGLVGLVVAPLVVAPVTWLMARHDLHEMRAGRMDPAGRGQTETARGLAMLSTLFWPLCLFCCGGGALVYQYFAGGVLVPAAGSHRLTKKEFDRVDSGMTKKQVTDLLGPPARTGYRDGRLNWYWYEKDGRATFSIDFDDNGRVRDMGIDTPD
jgi:hypothetical protein